MNGYDELSFIAASMLKNKIKNNDKLTLGFATGSTPIGTYRYLIEAYNKKEISFKNITSFNLDEYVGLHKEHPQSYHYFMYNHLFNYIDINPNNIYLPNGIVGDISHECERYEKAIERAGGVDIQILGIGSNGHIAFNEPGTPFVSNTHIVELDETTRSDNARFFDKIEEVPTHAITMGLNTIMKSKEILLLINGENKKAITEKFLKRDVSEDVPVSILHNHPKVTVVINDT